jgi:biofilm PGA synthesis N-glycosyltransferase PgaC
MTLLSGLFAALFLISAFLIFYTYVLFPAILSWLSGRQGPVKQEKLSRVIPVSIIMSAFNEEAVIGEKLLTIVKSDFPLDKLEVIVGSDASTDRTDEIVRELAKKYSNIKLHSYEMRRGKPAVINDLVSAALHPVIVLTDANVLF